MTGHAASGEDHRPMLVHYPFVHQDRDRHGNVRVYFYRRGGPKVRLREAPGSPAFEARYRELVAKAAAGEPLAETPGRRRPIPGTWRALCVDYFRHCVAKAP